MGQKISKTTTNCNTMVETAVTEVAEVWYLSSRSRNILETTDVD